MLITKRVKFQFFSHYFAAKHEVKKPITGLDSACISYHPMDFWCVM